MTHMAPIPESAGTFEKDSHPADSPCRKCSSTKVRYKVWESSCGSYEDYKFTCPDCNYEWWIDGIDS
jgi:transposase-like protein